MDKEFVPIHSAEAWQMSNAPVFSMAAHKASLDIFMEVDFDQLQIKRKSLNAFLRAGLAALPEVMKKRFTIITPENPNEHGCQVSLLFSEQGKAIFDFLSSKGIVADWREPNVIRVAPVPLYNSFDDVARLLTALANFD
jgi:kynureninase